MPTSQPSRPRSSLQRRLRRAVSERQTLKVAAIFFALVLWMVVSAEEPAEELVPVRVALVPLDSSIQLRTPMPQVRALVVGRGRELLKLYATPPTVRRAIGADVPETMLLELRPQDVDIPPKVDARVRDVQPRAIPLQFDIRTQRVVPVRSTLRVTPGEGVRLLGPPRFEPESVHITGSRRAVAAIGAMPTVATELVVRDASPHTVPLDTANLNVRVVPATVGVRVPVAPAIIDTLSDTARRASRDLEP